MSCGIYSLITSKLYVFSSWERKIKQDHQSRDTRVVILQDGLSRLGHKFFCIGTPLETEIQDFFR